MNRKNNRPQFHEPVSSKAVSSEAASSESIEVVVVEIFDPIESTIEVGEIILVDGPLEPVSLGEPSPACEAHKAPAPPADATPAPIMPDMSAVGDSFGGAKDAVADRVQDAVQGVTQAAQDAGQKAQEVVQDVAKTTQDAAQNVAAKAQDVAQTVSAKAQGVTQRVTDNASTIKAAASNALGAAKTAAPAAKGALGKIGTASASGAQGAGTALWLLFQRNPLQVIFVISSLVWLFRSNKAAASQPPVSITDAAGDAAEKVGSVAGHVQVAATNLSSQVSDQASRGASWFSKTLFENPLAIGAMAVVFGAGLGFSLPESSYENKLLGRTRDEIADKVQTVAQDFTQKVTTVAQTVAHDAVESAKAEARNQGLAGEAETPSPEQAPPAQDQS